MSHTKILISAARSSCPLGQFIISARLDYKKEEKISEKGYFVIRNRIFSFTRLAKFLIL